MSTNSSTSVHTVIILPGDTVRYYCKDGLSPLNFHHVQEILNFGGNLKAVDCGAANEWVATNQAYRDMWARFFNNRDTYDQATKDDIAMAMNYDVGLLNKFESSDFYRSWILWNNEFELKFQANA